MKMNESHYCTEKNGSKLYRIGLFAGINRVTIKTLRHYDEQGLLVPAYVDMESGYRYYTSSQIADLHQTLALKNMNFTLEEIREIQNGKSEKDLLRVKKSQILKEISELTAKLAQVESYLNEDRLDPSALVLVKSIPEVTVACMQRTIESYDEIFNMMIQMGAEMEKAACIFHKGSYDNFPKSYAKVLKYKRKRL